MYIKNHICNRFLKQSITQGSQVVIPGFIAKKFTYFVRAKPYKDLYLSNKILKTI